MRKNYFAPGLTNKKMSPAVYALRRAVIGLIYEAKRLVPSLPRIEVRVTDNSPGTLGCALMGGAVLWITEKSVASRHVVFHEILHAVYAQEHVAGCALMGPSAEGAPSDATLNALFLRYATKAPARG